jgi:MOSC domain
MREIELSDGEGASELDSLRACIATILELPLAAVPEPEPGEDAADWLPRRWLNGLGLGLVPIAEVRRFSWPGPWIGRLRSPARGGLRSVVMYGVPSGVVWDPAGSGEDSSPELVDGFLISVLDIALARPAAAEAPESAGIVEEIWVSAGAGVAGDSLASAQALPGQGLEGDRHVNGEGTFASGRPGSALTLIEAEVCQSFEPPLDANVHRRNILTRGIDLNALVGHEFTIGEVRCRGMRLCEPCTVVDGYASRPILRALVHRGGLRADILSRGLINVGDRVAAARGAIL